MIGGAENALNSQILFISSGSTGWMNVYPLGVSYLAKDKSGLNVIAHIVHTRQLLLARIYSGLDSCQVRNSE